MANDFEFEILSAVLNNKNNVMVSVKFRNNRQDNWKLKTVGISQKQFMDDKVSEDYWQRIVNNIMIAEKERYQHKHDNKLKEKLDKTKNKKYKIDKDDKIIPEEEIVDG